MLEKMMDMNVLLYCMAAFGALGAVGMFATHLTYRRVLKSTKADNCIREKWMVLWKTRDRLLNRMNRMVWYPSLLGIMILVTAVYLTSAMRRPEGLPLTYLYMGTSIPILLLLLRQALDFTYKETLILESLTDYVEQARVFVEEHPDSREKNPALREEIVEQIAEGIRQTAAAGSHFSKMLSEEEEEIIREVIREFMD